MAVACVPLHAVNAVAEHAIALLLALSRKLIISDRSVRNLNFLPDEPVGFDLYGKTIGIIGVGKIGTRIAQILHGFGCNLLGFDINPNVALQQQMGMRYADLSAICSQSDVISINTPLLPQTRYIINKKLIDTMKPGVILINTSRGACVNTEDIIEALASGHIGAYGADVYENEKNVFLKDQIDKDFQDTLLNKLLSFSNVLITPHLAFATREALHSSAATTFHIIDRWKMDNTADQELCGIQ
jgi:D-lactate dehydrogenase